MPRRYGFEIVHGARTCLRVSKQNAAVSIENLRQIKPFKF
ncbi:MAG: hypothetical protein OJF48_002532 [Afipia sp.]|nr:MAG: hypothetical protein OJF48_002532 [Afipia sp.]